MIIIPDLSGVFKSIIDTFRTTINVITDTIANNQIIGIVIIVGTLVCATCYFINRKGD